VLYQLKKTEEEPAAPHFKCVLFLLLFVFFLLQKLQINGNKTTINTKAQAVKNN